MLYEIGITISDPTLRTHFFFFFLNFNFNLICFHLSHKYKQIDNNDNCNEKVVLGV